MCRCLVILKLVNDYLKVFGKSRFLFPMWEREAFKSYMPLANYSSCNAFNVMGLRRGSCKLPKAILRGATVAFKIIQPPGDCNNLQM